MRRSLVVALLLAMGSFVSAAEKPPVYVWFEPEWFEGVKGSFNYWTGTFKPEGHWGIAGPGISAEFTQGGESEWNSMGAGAAETKASCHRDFVVPRGGKYKVWVRYVDHRAKTEPFTVTLAQGDKTAVKGELGVQAAVPPNDEYQLYWGFSFAWASLDANLDAGPAKLTLAVTRTGDAWRQLDAVLITDDVNYVPVGREKPEFGYLKTIALEPSADAKWRGEGSFESGASLKRIPLGGRDFAMWAGIDSDPKWWNAQKIDSLTLYDILFQFGPPVDIRDKFHKQFAGQREIPILAWKGFFPGLYLGTTPDLSPNTALRKWLEQTKTPFYIMTNYANPQYKGTTGPETYAALTGPLAGQFLGYIHGEAVGTVNVSHPHGDAKLGRRANVDAIGRELRQSQADAWTKFYGTKVPESYLAKSIPCMSVDSIALCHQFHEIGMSVLGYELDATNAHIPMRIAFERGAARQYGGAWINYASGNFGDACNYFTQNPVVPRGAPSWFHSKYTITDGVSIGWYRKLYYLNYFGGASAIYWEQNMTNQWILPGPGTHPIQQSPYGRATEDFQACVDRVPDRGEPLAPIALLLSYGHSYERVNNSCKMMNVFLENKSDIQLRELFNVCWYPAGINESKPITPDGQSMPSGRYGNIFDVLVDRPSRSKAVLDYPILWAAGDVELTGEWQGVIKDYLQRGGTLVINSTVANQLPADLLGLTLKNATTVTDQWSPAEGKPQTTIPFEVAQVELKGAKALATAGDGLPLITRHQVGKGAVIVTLVPNLVGQDERAHPSLPYLMNGLTSDLLPVDVRLPTGERLVGEVSYQVNKTKDGYIVLLTNNRGVDKTQHGIARVDRRAYADVVLRTRAGVKSAVEQTAPRPLTMTTRGDLVEIPVRVHPGDVQVISLTTGK